MDKETMMKVLKGCHLKVEDVEMFDSPTVTTFEIKPMPGAKVNSFIRLESDIAFALGKSVRCNFNDHVIEYEVAKDKAERRLVLLSEMLSGTEWEAAKKEMKLPVPLGVDTHGNKRYADLASMPHLIVGGATMQGKSMFINSLIGAFSAVRSREELQFRLLDNKSCEFKKYESEHKVVYGNDCATELRLINDEMNTRYDEIGRSSETKFPTMVVIVDEYSDFLNSKDFISIQKDVLRIAMIGRRVGIHIIVASQRMERNVITALLKANIPTCAAFRVSTSNDSKLLIDSKGAECLLGSGDMLFKSGGEVIRVQSATNDM